MTRDVDLTGATTAALDLQGRFDIEADYDYLYVQVSTDGGTTWTTLDGTVDGEPFVRDGSDQPAISGLVGRRVAARERAARRLRRPAGVGSGSATGPTAASPPTASSPTRSR